MILFWSNGVRGVIFILTIKKDVILINNDLWAPPNGLTANHKVKCSE